MQDAKRRTPDRRAEVLSLVRLLGDIDRVDGDRIAKRVADDVESRVRVETKGARS